MKFKTAVVCLLFALATLATTARAAVTTVTISGTLSEGQVHGSQPFLGYAVGTNLGTAGVSFTLFFTFDDSQGVEGAISKCSGVLCQSQILNSGSGSGSLQPAREFSLTLSGGSGGGTYDFGAAMSSSQAKLNTDTVHTPFGLYNAHVNSNNGVTITVYPPSGDSCWPTIGDWRRAFPCSGYTDTSLGSGSTNGSFSVYDTGAGLNATGEFSATSITVVGPACDIPISETTSYYGWDSSTHAEFLMTVYDIDSANVTGFSGQSVQEFNPTGYTGVDGCYNADPGLDTPFTTITGGTWTVTSSNAYGFDFVGWNSGPIGDYRGAGVVPCGTTVYQQMAMYCSADSTWWPYGAANTGDVNVLHDNIQATTLSSSRANVSSPNHPY